MIINKINKSKLFGQFFDKIKEKREIKYLVLHHIEAPKFDKAIEELLFHQVSSHYIIDLSGEVFQLVNENDIAYHAGFSWWRGQDSLNKSSLSIEFFNPKAEEKNFSDAQIKAGIALCQNIMQRHNIVAANVVGHSDIAYFSDNGHLNRKQDPSHLFPWQLLAKNGVGIWAEDDLGENEDRILLRFGEEDLEVKILKENLADLGYKIDDLDEIFDQQLESVITVFNRHFNSKIFVKDNNNWYLSSQIRLSKLISH